ncbi:MAG: ATP-binding protein [Actinomycetota bacterium]|nr:ATP-binding protein [Actinomycetota bacterium]
MPLPGYNPYTPGAGLYPPFLAGREVAIRRVEDVRLRIEDGGGSSPLVVVGVRGMGKTSLLLHFSDQLSNQGWLVPPLQEIDSRRRFGSTWIALRAWLTEHTPGRNLPKQKRWQSGAVTWNAGIEAAPTGPKARAGAGGSLDRVPAEPAGEELRRDVYAVLSRLAEDGVRVALLFDETQDARIDELGLLAELGQDAAKGRWPLLTVFGGLTPLSSRLVRARSYASHFETLEVGPLVGEAPREALRRPAEDRGVTFTESGLGVAVAFAQGIPYHLQVIGQKAWERSEGSITDAEVHAAESPAREAIEASMYRPLWDRASEAEQAYMLAMAKSDRNQYGAHVREVLDRLRTSHAVGAQTRARLIQKGMVHSVRHGFIDFSYPGFAAFAELQVLSTRRRATRPHSPGTENGHE